MAHRVDAAKLGSEAANADPVIDRSSAHREFKELPAGDAALLARREPRDFRIVAAVGTCVGFSTQEVRDPTYFVHAASLARGVSRVVRGV